MEKINKIVGDNLTFLRKSAGLTQLEFGEKFSYSDKTVSRWEQGDVLPSVDVLKQIADFYQVSVDYILTEHNNQTDFFKIIKNTPNYTNKIILITLAIVIVLAIAVTIFVASIYNNDGKIEGSRGWVAFLWAVPISFLIIAYSVKRFFHSRKWMLIYISCFVWSLLLAAFFTFLYKDAYWYLFFIGVPVQAGLILMMNLKQ